MPEPSIPLADVIRGLRHELYRAIEESRGERLRFELGPVELELQLQVTQEGSGDLGVRFWVVSAGGTVRRESALTHSVRLILNPIDSSRESVEVAEKLQSRPD